MEINRHRGCRRTPFAAWVLVPTRGHEAAAQSGPLQVNVVDVDIAAGQIDAYLAALKENAAASVHDPGCHEFNILVSQKDPNHVLLFEVWDSAAAVDAQFATDRFKKYQATTANMVAKRDIRAFSPVAMNFKRI